MLQVARKAADEIKEERSVHQLRSQVWVIMKALCDNGLKRREDYGECVDESQKNVYGLAHIGVVPLAEECSCKMVSLVKVCTYGMGQQCFSNSR